MPLAACGSDDDGGGGGEGGGLSSGGSQDAASGGTIKIGLLSTLEGPFAPFGEAANQGARWRSSRWEASWRARVRATG